jgi:ribose transport system permease protein
MTTQSTSDPGENQTSTRHGVAKWAEWLWHWIAQSQAMVLLVFLILLSIVISILAPRFLRIENFAVITRQASFVAIVSLGQMTALIAGVIDLSVGATAGLAGICAAMLMHHTSINPYLAILAGVLSGALVGLINGTLVTRLRLNPFIVTLSMAFVISGAILVLTGGWAIPNMPKNIEWIGRGSLGPVPVPTIIAIVVAALLAFMLNRTFIGRHIFAIGGNKEAANLVGIRVNAITTLVYVISGSLSALAGVMMLARLASGQPTVGEGWLLPSFAAPILGGAALTGGAGSALGTLVGATIMAVIQNGIVMTGLSVYWENVVVGLVLILAIIMDSLRTRNQ